MEYKKIIIGEWEQLGANYNRRKSNGRYKMVHLFLYTNIRTLEYIIFNYIAGKLFDANGRL
jgi:hypothetical protein